MRFKVILHFGFLILIFNFSFLIFNLRLAEAQTMSNKDYILKTQGLNSLSGTTSNETYELRSSAGELGTAVGEGVNFKVRTGFENIESALPFSVSLSQDSIDFGLLAPTNPIVRSFDLSVYSLPTFGYSVDASQDHALKLDSGSEEIPNTTCDNGNCNEEKAGIWTNTLTYGFGYRCDNITGTDCDKSFSNAEGTSSRSKFYKHFADNSNGQSPKFIMSGIGSKNKEIRMSYKVNISGNQTQGIYSNIVTYIAIPNF